MFKPTASIVLLLTQFTLFYLPGCSSVQVDENDPASLLQEAEEDIKNDHYQIAIEKLRSIKNKFPYSKYAVDAQLRIADVYFLQESFAEAAASYEAFKDLHPKHEKAAYASFRIGKSYLNDSPGNIARDLTSVQKALTAYNDFVRLYPNVHEETEARQDITAIRKILADKELYIGDFYFKRDFYSSAIPRYKKIIELFPETEAAKLAQGNLDKIESLEKMRENERIRKK